MEASLLGGYSTEAMNAEINGATLKTKVNRFEVGARNLFLSKGSIAIGPEFSYARVENVDGDSSLIRSDVSVFLLGKYIFGDIDRDVMLPYLFWGVGYIRIASSSTPATESASRQVGGFGYTGGVGLHYFLDSNVAVTPEISFKNGTLSNPDVGAKFKVTAVNILKLGFTLFL